MHTTETLLPQHFRCSTPGAPPGRPGDLEPLFPGFHDRDRVGVVSPRPLDGIAGAGCAVLAAVTAFYESRRGELSSSPVYPEFFAFHEAGAPGADAWGELDVWPASQWIATDGTPDALVAAARSRGVTRLLWPAGLALPTGARASFRSVVLYGAGAMGVELHAEAPVEELIQVGLTRVPGLDPALLASFHAGRDRSPDGGRIEHYQPVG